MDGEVQMSTENDTELDPDGGGLASYLINLEAERHQNVRDSRIFDVRNYMKHVPYRGPLGQSEQTDDYVLKNVDGSGSRVGY